MSRSLSVFVTLGLLIVLATPTVADKPGDAGSLQFRGSSFPISEEAGTVRVVVKRQHGSNGAVTVDYATADGSAVDGEDYEAASGTLEWDDGDRGDKSFTVTILDDDLAEGQETFGVRLLDPTGDAELGSVRNTVVRIKPSDRDDDSDSGGDDDDDDDDSGDGDDDDDDDDDGADGGVIQLTSIAFPAFESTGEATVVAERVEGSQGAVSVDFTTIDGSATAPADYSETAGILTWGDGEAGSKAIAVPLVDDAEDEGLETISFLLTRATGGASLGGRDVASIVIIDDDGADGSCVPDDETLCLQGGRFEVSGTWRDFQDAEGPFHFVPSTDDSGLAWFFSEDNVEVLIKVLDGCPINGNYWVFFAASTNVGFTLRVTDLESGSEREYVNPLGVVPLATTDVTAFATCP